MSLLLREQGQAHSKRENYDYIIIIHDDDEFVKAKKQKGAEMDIQKEKTAIQYLKLMGGGENDTYYLAYSGGKDSDVILALAKNGWCAF